MTRNEITEQIVLARLAKGLTWQQLADAIDRPVVDHLGPTRPAPDSRRSRQGAGRDAGLDESAIPVLAAVPMRGGLPTAVPTDPTIYRFYEALQVFGPALKELIHENFGDGIMSAINFSVDLQKKPHPSGDRVGDVRRQIPFLRLGFGPGVKNPSRDRQNTAATPNVLSNARSIHRGRLAPEALRTNLWLVPGSRPSPWLCCSG